MKINVYYNKIIIKFDKLFYNFEKPLFYFDKWRLKCHRFSTRFFFFFLMILWFWFGNYSLYEYVCIVIFWIARIFSLWTRILFHKFAGYLFKISKVDWNTILSCLTCHDDHHHWKPVIDAGFPRIYGRNHVLGVRLAVRAVAEWHRRVARLPQQQVFLGEPGYGNWRRVQDRHDFQRSVFHIVYSTM